MQIKTILNRIQKQRGFVYGRTQLVEEAGGLALHIELSPRARNRRPVCPTCRRRGGHYDTLDVRRFEFVPLWRIRVFFLSMMRRVLCPTCEAVRVEAVPWADGKRTVTTTYAWLLARWAKRLSWREVAQVFRTSWDHVFRTVEMAVTWGRTHAPLDGITGDRH